MALRLSKLSSFGFILLILFLNTSAWGEEYLPKEKGNKSIDKTDFDLVPFISLVPNVKYGKDNKDFTIYCFKNVHKSFFQIWRSVHAVLLHKPLDYSLFPGVNETEVHNNHKSKSIWHPSFIFSSSDTIIDFPAFSQYCLGIDTRDKYVLQLQVRTINYWKVLQTLLGVFILLTAPALSRNSFFHYSSGVIFGVLASLLILLYMFSRFIPQKSASYAVLLFGYSFIFYFLKVIWHHFNDILSKHTDIVLIYCIVTAFLSFVVCYRLGPVKSQRTCNIIQWSMQVFSMLLIFFSSEYREVSTALILVLLCAQMVPARWIKWGQFLWYRCFPPRVKLLTELEYIEQGSKETKKGLENLRKYCSSPDCNVWKVVRNLKDPVRFASFIDNGSHYTDQELLDYTSEELLEEDSETIQNHTGNHYL